MLVRFLWSNEMEAGMESIRELIEAVYFVRYIYIYIAFLINDKI